MTSLASSPIITNKSLLGHEPDSLNTIPDPRTPSPLSHMRSFDRSLASPDTPDIDNEVATLSTKLIHAINHSTSLDDALQSSRHELDAAARRIAQLETTVAEHTQAIANGALVSKAHVDKLTARFEADLDTARRERELAEQGRRQMELEVENLTSSLFEEANKMVADVRRDHETAEKRNQQLLNQLHDNQTLLASQNEQLQGLKDVVGRLGIDRDHSRGAGHIVTAPPSPGHEPSAFENDVLDTLSPCSPASLARVLPDQPLHFSNLIYPVIRTDLQAYNEFLELLKVQRPHSMHTRSSSGDSSLPTPSGPVTSTKMISALVTSSPNLPGSFTPSGVISPREAFFNIATPLKDSKFFKRCLTEDIEPVLRLDTAPGLSWLARRSVLTSITTGAFIIEPDAPTKKPCAPINACALCGEDRQDEAYARQHRFRTSDDSSAQRYPLCEYCLGRMRATADFVGFLRTVRDGLWRAQTDADLQSAWEECIRLKEKMFWARVGGGVVPAVGRGNARPHTAEAALPRRTPSSDTRTTDGITYTAELRTDPGGVIHLELPTKRSEIAQSVPSSSPGVAPASPADSATDPAPESAMDAETPLSVA